MGGKASEAPGEPQAARVVRPCLTIMAETGRVIRSPHPRSGSLGRVAFSGHGEPASRRERALLRLGFAGSGGRPTPDVACGALPA